MNPAQEQQGAPGSQGGGRVFEFRGHSAAQFWPSVVEAVRKQGIFLLIFPFLISNGSGGAFVDPVAYAWSFTGYTLLAVVVTYFRRRARFSNYRIEVDHTGVGLTPFWPEATRIIALGREAKRFGVRRRLALQEITRVSRSPGLLKLETEQDEGGLTLPSFFDLDQVERAVRENLAAPDSGSSQPVAAAVYQPVPALDGADFAVPVDECGRLNRRYSSGWWGFCGGVFLIFVVLMLLALGASILGVFGIGSEFIDFLFGWTDNWFIWLPGMAAVGGYVVIAIFSRMATYSNGVVAGHYRMLWTDDWLGFGTGDEFELELMALRENRAAGCWGKFGQDNELPVANTMENRDDPEVETARVPAPLIHREDITYIWQSDTLLLIVVGWRPLFYLPLEQEGYRRLHAWWRGEEEGLPEPPDSAIATHEESGD